MLQASTARQLKSRKVVMGCLAWPSDCVCRDKVRRHSTGDRQTDEQDTPRAAKTSCRANLDVQHSGFR